MIDIPVHWDSPTPVSLNDYQIVSQRDSNGTFVAYIPAIQGCHAWGETREAAEKELENVFAMFQEEAIEKGCELPPDVELVIAHAS